MTTADLPCPVGNCRCHEPPTRRRPQAVGLTATAPRGMPSAGVWFPGAAEAVDLPPRNGSRCPTCERENRPWRAWWWYQTTSGHRMFADTCDHQHPTAATAMKCATAEADRRQQAHWNRRMAKMLLA